MKVAILTSERSGSTFLQEAIDSHPLISSYGEILGQDITLKQKGLKGFRDQGKSAYEFLDDVYFNNLYTPNNNICVKIMYRHFVDNKLIDYFKTRKIEVLHLIRNNLLDKFISKKYAHKGPKNKIDDLDQFKNYCNDSA